MTAPRLLIVGFGAFPSVPRNPSGILARRVAASPRLKRVLGVPPRLLVLRTAYASLESALAPALAKGPDAIVMIGVAMRARRIRVEFRARNRANGLFPDAEGRASDRHRLDRNGPAQRTSRPAAKVLTLLRRHRLDAAASCDAGAYLCNASYFRALATGAPTVFLHIPRLPDPGRPSRAGRVHKSLPLDAWASACVDVGLSLTVDARRLRRGGDGARER